MTTESDIETGASIESTSPDDLSLPLADNMVVLAKDPQEMRVSQERLAGWFGERVKSAQAELDDAQENLALAKKRKWATQGWTRQVSLARGRVNFYTKCQAAIEEGFCIVPDFPAQVFAIRTKKLKPKKNARTQTGWHPEVQVQRTDSSPAGEGEYVSPQANETERHKEVVDSDGRSRTQITAWATTFREPDFPMKRVKPQILDATGTAMALKIFDEIGVLPARRTAHRARDPIVTGRIVRREGPYTEIGISFLIYWWIDTRDL
jgi:hypothetical protein